MKEEKNITLLVVRAACKEVEKHVRAPKIVRDRELKK